jgi:hypothetical protein
MISHWIVLALIIAEIFSLGYGIGRLGKKHSTTITWATIATTLIFLALYIIIYLQW